MNFPKFEAAKQRVLIKQPFYSCLLFQMTEKLVTHFTLPTGEVQPLPLMGVDGKHLFINPARVEEYPVPYLEMVLIHEAQHLVFRDPVYMAEVFRTEGERYNEEAMTAATEVFANRYTEMAGYEIPPEAVHDRERAYSSFDTSLELYKHLRDNPGEAKKLLRGPGEEGEEGFEGKPGSGDPTRADVGAPGVSGPELKEVEDRLKDMVRKAAAAVGAGNIPGSVKLLLEDLADPKVPWRSVLRPFLQSAFRQDTSWSRPNRRFQAHETYLPGKVSDGSLNVAVILDVSGSMTGSFTEVLSELNGILAAYAGASGYVIPVDTEVREEDILEFDYADLPLKVNCTGGGGTEFAPGFRWLEARGANPGCAIYLTDGYGSFPETVPPYPVLWCFINTSVREAPFGISISVGNE